MRRETLETAQWPKSLWGSPCFYLNGVRIKRVPPPTHSPAGGKVIFIFSSDRAFWDGFLYLLGLRFSI
jgi:hypothetical protein